VVAAGGVAVAPSPAYIDDIEDYTDGEEDEDEEDAAAAAGGDAAAGLADSHLVPLEEFAFRFKSERLVGARGGGSKPGAGELGLDVTVDEDTDDEMMVVDYHQGGH
jgi:hypothetical protein